MCVAKLKLEDLTLHFRFLRCLLRSLLIINTLFLTKCYWWKRPAPLKLTVLRPATGTFIKVHTECNRTSFFTQTVLRRSIYRQTSGVSLFSLGDILYYKSSWFFYNSRGFYNCIYTVSNCLFLMFLMNEFLIYLTQRIRLDSVWDQCELVLKTEGRMKGSVHCLQDKAAHASTQGSRSELTRRSPHCF